MGNKELAIKIVEAINEEENNYDAIDVVTQILKENEKEEEVINE